MGSLLQETDSSISFYLGHLVSSSPAGTGTRYQYTTFPIRLVPPEQGQAMLDCACPACHAKLRLRVRSTSAVARIRTRLRVIAGALGVFAGIDLAFLFPPAVDTARQAWGALIALSLLAALILFAVSKTGDIPLAVALKEPEGRSHDIFETVPESV